jgi:hypothetical protein
MRKTYVSLTFLVFTLALLLSTVPMMLSQTPPDQTTKQEAVAVAAVAQTQADQARAAQAERDIQRAMEEVLIKTYTLKYVSPSEVLLVARPYVIDSTGANNVLTVRIQRKYVPDFEALLKKLDIEKKNILLRIYTIDASRELFSENYLKRLPAPPNQVIEDKDLKKVLDELKGLWNFKSYYVDTPSFLTVKDGAGSNSFRLVSTLQNLEMDVRQIKILGEEIGKRTVAIGQIQMSQIVYTPNATNHMTLIDTKDVSVKENGYLIVGVSGYSPGFESGHALILVISAEIK